MHVIVAQRVRPVHQSTSVQRRHLNVLRMPVHKHVEINTQQGVLGRRRSVKAVEHVQVKAEATLVVNAIAVA